MASPWTFVVCLWVECLVHAWKSIYIDLRLYSCDLALGFSAFLQLGHLLSLNRWSCYFLTKNDIPHLTDSKRGNVDAVAFAKVLCTKNKLEFKGNWKLNQQQGLILSWQLQLWSIPRHWELARQSEVQWLSLCPDARWFWPFRCWRAIHAKVRSTLKRPYSLRWISASRLLALCFRNRRQK